MCSWPRSFVSHRCGGLYNYFFGVACYLQDHFDVGPDSGTVFASASAGAFPAFALAAGLDVRELFFSANRALIEGVAEACSRDDPHVYHHECRLRPLGRWNALVQGHFSAVAAARLGGSEQAAACVRGRLFVSVTALPSMTNELISDFADADDLIGCFLASAYVPVYDDRCRPAALWRGRRYIDGGLTDNCPVPFGPHAANNSGDDNSGGDASAAAAPPPDIPSLVLTTEQRRDHSGDTGLLPWVRADWGWCEMKFGQGLADAEAHHTDLAAVLPPRRDKPKPHRPT